MQVAACLSLTAVTLLCALRMQQSDVLQLDVILAALSYSREES